MLGGTSTTRPLRSVAVGKGVTVGGGRNVAVEVGISWVGWRVAVGSVRLAAPRQAVISQAVRATTRIEIGRPNRRIIGSAL
jgi:hypothetical protein